MTTPLLDFLRAATPEERKRTAALAGTQVSYLYQLATCVRPRISATLAIGIEDATRLMHTDTDGRLPVVDVRTLATMCALRGL
jgi:hypothetical protein